MGCYALALLALIRIVVISRRESATATTMRFAATMVCGTLLGLGCAAVYILPAVFERRWVQVKMAIITGMDFSDNFLFRRNGDIDHDTVLRTASILAVVMIALTAVSLFFAAKRAKQAWQIAALATLAFVIVLLLTPLSAPIWSHTPELAFLQFPWRLVAVLAAVFGLALADALPPLRQRDAVIAALLAAVVFSIPAYRAFRQSCYPEDTVAARLAVFQSANPGTDPTDEYTPTTADNDVLAHDNPPWWLADSPNAPAPKGAAAQPGPAPRELNLTLDRPQTLVLNLRKFPTWSVRTNGASATLAYRNDGLIAIPLSAGPAQVLITWQNGWDHTCGQVITAVSLLLLATLGLRRRKASQAAQHLSSSLDARERPRPASLRRAAC
jgi:hypothetical protein